MAESFTSDEKKSFPARPTRLMDDEMKQSSEKGVIPEFENSDIRQALRGRRRRTLTYLILSVSICFLIRQYFPSQLSLAPPRPVPSQPSFDHLSGHCKAQPIPSSEFHLRQKHLSETLHRQASFFPPSYILEPGANAGYFANISFASWKKSERPLLIILTPLRNSKLTIQILTPKFESSRARQVLQIPAETTAEFIEWAEDEDPYSILARALGPETVIIDEDMRYFVSEGLRSAGFRIVRDPAASKAVKQIRERKTEREVEILRCANELTLLAIREVRERMWIGMKESEARALVSKALLGAGLGRNGGGTFITVQFGESAALPHGGGNDRELSRSDLITFDVGGSLEGYWSDVTRTFALPSSAISSKHLDIWFTVSKAQIEALKAAKKGVQASAVDAAARRVIDRAGNGKHFTHRLGHGIGMELHESPYLRGGNDTPLQIGNTFSDEPGIYIEGEIGVRLEDCFFVDESGVARLLTERVGGAARSPWMP